MHGGDILHARPPSVSHSETSFHVAGLHLARMSPFCLTYLDIFSHFGGRGLSAYLSAAALPKMGKVPEGRKGTGAPNYPRRTLAEPERSLNPNRMVTGAPEGFWIVHLFGFGGWDDEGAGGGGAHHVGIFVDAGGEDVCEGFGALIAEVLVGIPARKAPPEGTDFVVGIGVFGQGFCHGEGGVQRFESCGEWIDE